ncbi:MAG TPA: hypothetical protein VFW62_04465, partial [bacterium]|nr:hypothetical protein [bacterium]
QVGLSTDQSKQVETLVAELKTILAKGNEQERQVATAEHERKLAALLTKEQKSKWDAIAGKGNAAPTSTKTGEVNEPMKTGSVTPKISTPSRPAESNGPPQKGEVATKGPNGEVLLQFQFRYAPWKEVLDWFAEQADLSMDAVEFPSGTFNYTDKKKYTPEQALNLLNGLLASRGFMLLKHERMLVVINLENGEIPPHLVTEISEKELATRGEFEIVAVLFQLNKMTPEEAEVEINKLKGPQGKVVVLSKAKQVYVREMAGKLRTIKKMIDAIEHPVTPATGNYEIIKLEFLHPNEFLIFARPLLGIPDNTNSKPDGNLVVGVDEFGKRLLATGKPDALEELKKVVKLLDVDPNA